MAWLATVVAVSLVVPAVAAFGGASSNKSLVWSLCSALVLALSLALSQIFHHFEVVGFLAKRVDDIRHVKGFGSELACEVEGQHC